MNDDEQNLKLLSIFHYVLGGITGLFACLPFIHVAMGIALVSGAFPVHASQPPPPDFFGWFFIIIGSVMILIGWSLAIAILFAGRFLASRSRYMYCFVVAAIECVCMPFGTILGVFTIIVLSRPTVKALFGQSPTP